MKSCRSTSGDDGASPVVGAIFIMAITVLGMGAALTWGIPAIQRVQDQNNFQTMLGEFEEVRAGLLQRVQGASRSPEVDLPGGTLSLTEGSSFVIVVAHDADNPNCELRLEGWADHDTKVQGDAQFSIVDNGNCRTMHASVDCETMPAGDACLESYKLIENATEKLKVNSTSLSGGIVTLDRTMGDSMWGFQLTNNGTGDDREVYADMWIHHSDQLRWSHRSLASDITMDLEAGAVFTRWDDRTFVDAQPFINEDGYGTDVFDLFLPTMNATSLDAAQGDELFTVPLNLRGVMSRVAADDAYKLRLDFHGEDAETWCEAMLVRDQLYVTGATGNYALPSDLADCSDPGSDDIRSVEYVMAKAPLRVEVTHAVFQVRITT